MSKRTKAIRREEARAYRELASYEPGSKEYKEIMEQIVVFNTIQKSSVTLNNDVIVTGIFQIVSLLAVLQHEHLGIITGKAIGFLPKILRNR